MKTNILDWFADMMPLRKKTAADWIVPASVGLGIGLAAGVGIGLIVAPKSGYETRRQLRLQADKVRDRARLAADKAKDKLLHAANKERSFVTEAERFDEAGGLR